MSQANIRKRLKRVGSLKKMSETQATLLLSRLMTLKQEKHDVEQRIVGVNEQTQALMETENTSQELLMHLERSNQYLSDLYVQLDRLALMQHEAIENYLAQKQKNQGWEKLESKLAGSLESLEAAAVEVANTDRYLSGLQQNPNN